MEQFLEDPRTWVALAFVLFIAAFAKKIGGAVASGLDARAARIKSELDEARRLRAEAESLLAEYRQKQAEYVKEAETMLADAHRDAQALRLQAEKELQAALDARTKQAMDRIAQEEANAISDIRNHVVDTALAAVYTLIESQDTAQDELLSQALSDIERKVH